MSELARRLGCTPGQLVTAVLGLLIAVTTLVATAVGVHNGPPPSTVPSAGATP